MFETAVYRPGSYFSESVMSFTPLSHCLILFSPHASMAYSKIEGEMHLTTTGVQDPLQSWFLVFGAYRLHRESDESSHCTCTNYILHLISRGPPDLEPQPTFLKNKTPIRVATKRPNFSLHQYSGFPYILPPKGKAAYLVSIFQAFLTIPEGTVCAACCRDKWQPCSLFPGVFAVTAVSPGI